MNFRKNWKQFWTLDRHHAEGFTLVELIVVIAILAILSAVAVPAYSGYITKTHKTNDQKLVSEVSDALQLYFYANPGNQSAWVVLTPEGNVSYASEHGAKAMEAVFGSNWAATTLSYGKWDESDSGMLGAAATGGADVLNSSFLQGSTRNELLQNVSSLTSAAAGLVSNRNPQIAYNGMVNMFANGDQTAFDALCESYGITVQNENGSKTFGSDVTSTQLSNLMVAAAAKEFTNSQANGTEPSGAAAMVGAYATLTAYIASGSANETDIANYNALNDAINAENVTASGVQSALDACMTGVDPDEFNAYLAGQGATDQAAINALLSAVNTAAGTMNGNDLSDADLFTTGKGANAFNTYVSAAEALAELGTVPANSIAVFLNAETGVPEIYCSNPEAYLQGK